MRPEMALAVLMKAHILCPLFAGRLWRRADGAANLVAAGQIAG
jgi:hypothetical protein